MLLEFRRESGIETSHPKKQKAAGAKPTAFKLILSILLDGKSYVQLFDSQLNIERCFAGSGILGSCALQLLAYCYQTLNGCP